MTGLGGLERCAHDNQNHKRVVKSQGELCKVAEDRFGRLEKDGFHVLIRLLKSRFGITLGPNAYLSHREIEAVSAAYVCALAPQMFQSIQICDSVCAHDWGRSYIQKAVTTSTYNAASEGRYYSVMLTFDTRSIGTRNRSRYATYKIWLGRALEFLRVCKERLECNTCESHCRRACSVCDYNPSSEVCFL